MDGTTQGFNGAVTFSLRKLLYSDTFGIPVAQLQWGRNFFVTEIFFHIDVDDYDTSASMGP